MTDQTNIARTIAAYRGLFHDLQVAGNRVGILVDGVNWASSPTALLTDREHRATRRFRRWAMIRLARFGGWYETENGRLVTGVRRPSPHWRLSPYAAWADRP